MRINELMFDEFVIFPLMLLAVIIIVIVKEYRR